MELMKVYRTAGGYTVLVEVGQRVAEAVLVVEEVVGCPVRGLIELPGRAVKRAGAGLEHLVDGAAAGVPERGIGIEGLDADFLHSVLRGG